MINIRGAIQVGKEYLIKQNTSGHGFRIGEKIKVIARSGIFWTCESLEQDGVGLRYSVKDGDIDSPSLTRVERVAVAKEEIEKRSKEIEELKAEIVVLEKYKSDEEEVAALIVTASDPTKTEQERIIAIAEVLKTRAKTNFV